MYSDGTDEGGPTGIDDSDGVLASAAAADDGAAVGGAAAGASADACDVGDEDNAEGEATEDANL